jgi:hypothetical protein
VYTKAASQTTKFSNRNVTWSDSTLHGKGKNEKKKKGEKKTPLAEAAENAVHNTINSIEKSWHLNCV